MAIFHFGRQPFENHPPGAEILVGVWMGGVQVLVPGNGSEPEAEFSGIHWMLGVKGFLGRSVPGIQDSGIVRVPHVLGSC